jgi:hypothetical protein
MEIPHEKYIQFYRECYESDNRAQNLWDIFGGKHWHLHVNSVLDEDQIIDGERLMVDPKYGTMLEKNVKMYRRERKFLCAGIFMVGSIEGFSGFAEGRRKKICSPLLFWDANIEQRDSSFYISREPETIRWNYNLLGSFVEDRNSLHELEALIDKESTELPDLRKLKDWLAKYSTAEIIFKGGFAIKKKLEKVQEESVDEKLQVFGGSAFIHVLRSRSSRGIIDELETLADSTDFSRPLKQLFSEKHEPIANFTKSNSELVPGILSNAQEGVLENAVKEQISMVVGPPGTGKSYTIASIVLERFLKGESVLVVSNKAQAVDVIQEKLVDNLAGLAQVVVRAGDRNGERRLITYLQEVLSGTNTVSRIAGESLHLEIRELLRKIKVKEHEFNTRSEKSLKTGKTYGKIKSGKANFFNKISFWFSKSGIDKEVLLKELIDEIRQMHDKREGMIAKQINHVYLDALNNVLLHDRWELRRLLKAQIARTSLRQETMFDEIDFDILLSTMPIWLCTLGGLHEALPLRKELFDLVIFDEATQCDIASALPALQRAKRAVIVGDPKQLRHISFLSRQRQNAIIASNDLEGTKIDLNYRDHSIIDLVQEAVSSQEAVVTLNEHYRSQPPIIAFSNKKFYSGSLRVMKERPVHYMRSPIEIVQCHGKWRNKVNREECAQILERVRALVDEQKDIPEEQKLSIGILSFFSNQAEYIGKKLFKEFTLDELTAHRLRTGTAYSFQGEERDIMMISCVVDAKSVGSAYQYMNRDDVFNVAITRARDLQILFTSLEKDEMPSTSLLREYIDSISFERKKHEHKNRSEYIDEVSTALRAMGMDVYVGYPIAGIPMDMVLVYEKGCIVVDLIGFPGEFEDPFELDRYKIFERAGLSIFPLSLMEWAYRKEQVLEQFEHFKNTFKVTSDNIEMTAQTLTGHWHKLLEINSALAKKVRLLELELYTLNEDRALDQIGAMLEGYQRFIFVLNEKLNVEELTYSRYKSAADKTLVAFMNNLKKIVLLKRSLPENDEEEDSESELFKDLFEEQKQSIEKIIGNNDEAIKRIGQIALSWSQTDTSGGKDVGMKTVLDQLEQLNDLVKKFDSSKG